MPDELSRAGRQGHLHQIGQTGLQPAPGGQGAAGEVAGSVQEYAVAERPQGHRTHHGPDESGSLYPASGPAVLEVARLLAAGRCADPTGALKRSVAFCFWNFIRKDRMTKDGNKLVREICALLFACALALITLALYSFSPDDPGFNHQAAAGHKTRNLAGALGSYAAGGLVDL